MAQCPNCGATVEDGAPVCDSCGMSLGEDVVGDDGGQGPGQGNGGNGEDTQHDHPESGHQRGGEPQQGGQPRGGQPQQGRAQGGQPQGGQPGQGQPQGGQPRQGQPQGGQPQQGQPQGQAPPQQRRPGQGQYGQQQQGQYRQPRDDEVVAGLSRRQVLGIGGAGIGVVAVGGFVLLGGGGGPAGNAESFVNALISGDGQAAADLLHPESPLSEQDVREQAVGTGGVNIEVQGAEVIEQSDDQATVEVTALVEGTEAPLRLDMRTANGEWRVFAFSGA